MTHFQKRTVCTTAGYTLAYVNVIKEAEQGSLNFNTNHFQNKIIDKMWRHLISTNAKVNSPLSKPIVRNPQSHNSFTNILLKEILQLI
jgi:hypothetical protein